MNCTVLKFGGSSVASATNMSRVLDLVEACKGKVILVSSAISGCTDALLDGSSAMIDEMERRHRAIVRRLFTGADRVSVQERIDDIFQELRSSDFKVIYGEILSTTILALKLRADGYDTLWLDSRRLVIKGEEEKTYARIAEAMRQEAQIYVAPGFICQDASGAVSTLGRGGSDYSAALYAAAVDATSLQIWTDVPGIMTANPKQVPAARTVPVMTYSEAFTMARSGAKVLYAPTVAPAMAKGIDIQIRNTFCPDGGYTVIGRESAGAKVGLASAQNGPLTDISLVGEISADDTRLALEALLQAGMVPIKTSQEEGKTVFSVYPQVGDRALNVLHRTFFESAMVRDIPVFIAGAGAVAQALRQLITGTAESITARSGKRLVIAGMANSRSYAIDLSGIDGSTPWKDGNFIDEVCRLAPGGAVFVDATNSETIHRDYTRILRSGINLVSSNRRSLAVPYVEYAEMNSTARERGLFFRYGTTVGAALPILESITRGANSSDELLSLEAVVSCTLNQILSEYDPALNTFAQCLKKAQLQGLTEADPRLDIGGRDALRKLLILAREAGIPLEEDQIRIEPLVPRSEGTIEDFYSSLECHEPHLASLAREAASSGRRLRFVASLEKKDGRYEAAIMLREVEPGHPAYYIKGTENAIIIRSTFKPYPLMIQGPGEGAMQAASSLLDDILR